LHGENIQQHYSDYLAYLVYYPSIPWSSPILSRIMGLITQ